MPCCPKLTLGWRFSGLGKARTERTVVDARCAAYVHPMRPVTLRSVSDSRVKWAQAAYEVECTDDHVVLSVPVGSPNLSRGGVRGGPRGTFLLPDLVTDDLQAGAWKILDVVMVHRFGDSWSTWRWLDADRGWTSGCYINLECGWTRSQDSMYDTEDLTLDLVVDDEGHITFKDEHELAWAEDEGYYMPGDAALIRTIGKDAYAHFSARGWPLGADWDQWKPAPGRVPDLQHGWDAVHPDYRHGRPSLRAHTRST
jgi:hypothetical protein